MAGNYVVSGYVKPGYIGNAPIIYWNAKIVFVPKNILTEIGTNLYELDISNFKKQIRVSEASDVGVSHPKIIEHKTTTLLSGVEYARTVEIVNGYTVTFENGVYAVNLVGANTNIQDVLNINSVSIRGNNSAGLQIIQGGSGLSTEEHNELMSLATTSAEKVWAANVRTLTESLGLTVSENAKLMGLPTAIENATEVWSKDLGV